MSKGDPLPTSPASGIRYLILNADDFGQTSGINRGIVECHRRGIVTSTSMMVTGSAVEDAVMIARDSPQLAVGLHFDVWGEDEREFDTHDLARTRAEFLAQLDRFAQVLGRMPTHIDSHRHAHREPHLFPHFLEWARDIGVPVRGDGKVNFVGGFYGQWEWKVTELQYVGVPFLTRMIQEEVPSGITEFSCHPGYVDVDYRGVYAREREVEIATLTDPAIANVIDSEGIQLISYAQYASAATSVAR